MIRLHGLSRPMIAAVRSRPASAVVFHHHTHRAMSSSGDDHSRARFDKLISSGPCFVFMKGTPEAPRCGFSAQVIKILSMEGAKFKTFDVLSESETWKEKIKEYAEFPTFPQVYLNGELVGGCNILIQHFQEGDLEQMLKDAGATRES